MADLRRAMGLLVALAACACSPPATDPCADAPCAAIGGSFCVVSQGEARCRCLAGQVVSDFHCIDPLRCPAGQQPVDGACVPLPSPCPEHAGDGHEPNDCAVKAWRLAVGPSAADLTPAGDEDWYRFGPLAASSFFKLRATAAVPLSVSLFDARLQPLGGAQSDDAIIAVSGSGYVRVRARDATATPAYTLTLLIVGTDDVGDDARSAADLAVPGALSGRLEMPEDVDVVRLVAPPKTALTLNWDLSPVRARVVSLDGGWASFDDARRFTVPPGQTAFLEFGGDGVAGAWGVRLASDGTDDRSDVPLFAEPVPTGVPVSVVVEHQGDRDCVLLDYVPGRRYALRGMGSRIPLPTSGAGLMPACFDYPQGSYQFTFVELGPDEDESGAAVLALDSSVSGTLPGDDVDRFVLDVPPGHTVSLRLSNGAAMTIVRPDGTTLPNATHEVYSELGGRFVITLRPNASTSYLLTATDLGPDDVPNAYASAQPLAYGAVSGIAAPDDRDVFELLLDPALNSTLECTTSDGTSCALLSSMPLPATDVLAFQRPAGRVWAEPRVNGGVHYRLQLVNRGLDDWPDTEQTAAELDAGVPVSRLTVTGTFWNPSDVDAFTFVAPPGALLVSCDCQALVAGAGFGNFSGWGIAQDVATTSRVFVRTTPVYSGAGATTHFTLHIDLLGADDFPCPGPGPLFTGNHFSGVTELPQDRDCIQVATTPGHVYSFDGTQVVDASGAQIPSPFLATQATMPIVVVGPWGAPWAVDLIDFGPDDYPDQPGPGLVELVGAGPVTGRFELTHDADVFSLTAPRGDPVTVTVSSPHFESMLLPPSPGTIVGSSVTLGATPGGWVAVRGSPATLATAPYVVTATTTPDDYSGEVPTLVDAGSVVTGNTHGNDLDLFQVATSPGDLVTTTLTSSVVPSVGVELRDPAGVLVSSPARSDGGVFTIGVAAQPWCPPATWSLRVGVGP
ncbi:MAG: hypothetical protein U0228_14025 [Myxococcaceae bacterium]